MKTILLSGEIAKGKCAIVDDDIFRLIGFLKWHLSKGKNYILRQEWDKNLKKCHVVMLHHIVMGKPKKGFQVDHINGNKLDNRRENLRIVTQAQNQWNIGLKITNISGFRGVHWYKRNQKWRSAISINGKIKHLGYFTDKIDAAKAYDEMSKKVRDNFAYLNFK